MSYAQLYAQCQALEGRIGRKQLFPRVAELTRIPKPRLQVSSLLNPQVLCGFIVFPDGNSHALAQYCNGKPLIVVARGLDVPWQRFVMIKELMHYFDAALEKVSSNDEFESLLSEMSGARLPHQSPAMRSEAKGFWMALGVICREAARQTYQRQLDVGDITEQQIANDLGIPASIVAHLFEPTFKSLIDGLIRE